jgi:hypothetical protein
VGESFDREIISCVDNAAAYQEEEIIGDGGDMGGIC